MRVSILWTISLVVFSAFGAGAAQGQECSVSLARIPSAAQIFGTQQERALGDIEAQLVETDYHVAQNEKSAVHLNAIAARVLTHFPREQARVRVILIDFPAAEAFTAGPERIYISKRMVGLLRSDDELAGLLGHELGHIVTHENAVIVSQLFQEILGVRAVGDRKDISEKLRRMLDGVDRDKKLARKAANVVERREEINQSTADRVALYAAAASGFSPQSYVELFDRSAETNGNSGGVLDDLFGTITSNRRRLREMKNALRQLPQPCQEIAPVTSTDFLTWQDAVMSDRELSRR
jgi:predicted Zn-dependent protease